MKDICYAVLSQCPLPKVKEVNLYLISWKTHTVHQSDRQVSGYNQQQHLQSDETLPGEWHQVSHSGTLDQWRSTWLAWIFPVNWDKNWLFHFLWEKHFKCAEADGNQTSSQINAVFPPDCAIAGIPRGIRRRPSEKWRKGQFSPFTYIHTYILYLNSSLSRALPPSILTTKYMNIS